MKRIIKSFNQFINENSEFNEESYKCEDLEGVEYQLNNYDVDKNYTDKAIFYSKDEEVVAVMGASIQEEDENDNRWYFIAETPDTVGENEEGFNDFNSAVDRFIEYTGIEDPQIYLINQNKFVPYSSL